MKPIMKVKISVDICMTIVLLLLMSYSMAGSMASGVILSRHALAFLPINASMSFAWKLHMVCAYWGFILMSLHLGIHWCIITGINLCTPHNCPYNSFLWYICFSEKRNPKLYFYENTVRIL